jgi:hypothetical protein
MTRPGRCRIGVGATTFCNDNSAVNVRGSPTAGLLRFQISDEEVLLVGGGLAVSGCTCTSS